jgi:hypothetical protein
LELGSVVALEVPTSRLASEVELVDKCLVGVDEFVHDLQECRNCGGARLVNLLKDLVIIDALLVIIDDLVIPDTDADVVVLEELVGVDMKPLIGLHGHPPEVEGVSKAIVGLLEVGREGL